MVQTKRKRRGRRDKTTIVGDILEAVARADEMDEDRLTVLADEANLPYDRFVTLIVRLQQRGLIDAHDPRKLTADGRVLLARYRDLDAVLVKFRIHELA